MNPGGWQQPAAPAPAMREGDGYARMERALDWLAANFQRQPALAETAAVAGLSEYHFQRSFSCWVGLSPKKFVQVLTLERAKAALREASVLEAAYAAGLSGPGRLHDLFVQLEAVTPGEYRGRGRGLVIAHGWYPSPFGECLLLHTTRGVCGLAFAAGRGRGAVFESLRAGYERARFVPDEGAGETLVRRAFTPDGVGTQAPLRLLVRGTPFQVRVWRALLALPRGALTTYESLAAHLGTPAAARAVGRAVACNPVAWLIPCHRVIRKSGLLAGYRWGAGRKLAMLSLETGGA